jgi:hypothetical protein
MVVFVIPKGLYAYDMRISWLWQRRRLVKLR